MSAKLYFGRISRFGRANLIVLMLVFLGLFFFSSLAMAQSTQADFKARMITTPDGVVLYAQEWGNSAGPEILFIHGFSQSHLSFIRQTRSTLAKDYRMITYDLRGHGGSDKPAGPEYYKEGKRWADDVRAVMDAFKLKKPVVVAWSMGGRVISQYLAIYGQDRLSGINFVGARTIVDPKRPTLGPGALNYLGLMLSDNLETNITATRAFVYSCTSKALLLEELDFLVAFNMTCPAYARKATQQWPGDFTTVLADVTIPVLISHGRADQVVLPAAAELTASLIKGSKIKWFDYAGHMTFWEDPARFNQDLAQFVKEINGR